MKPKEMIEVIRAAELGKTIQSRPYRSVAGPPWADNPAPSWDFATFEFRVKPEPPKPREFYLNIYKNGAAGQGWPSKDDALCAAEDSRVVGTIKVREVLE